MSVTGWDGVTLTVEIAMSAATSVYGLWNAAVWDSGLWGPDIVWTDVTAYVRSLRTSRGFSRGVQAWQAGTATVVLGNRDARFSAGNLSGPYVSGGVTQVRPLRPIRIRASYASTSYAVYYGYVLDWQETWIPAGPAAGDAIVTLACADEFTRLAAFDGMAGSAVGAGELSGARIHRVLDSVGYSGDRNIDTGEATMQATTLESEALTELQDVTDAEGGALWVEADGAVTFDGQFALIENSRSITSQATYGDTSGELRYVDAAVAYDADQVVNYAAYTRTGGTAQVADDDTSRALYGSRRDTVTDLACETDAQALALAQWRVLQYKDPEQRFTSLTIAPRAAPTSLWPQALGRRIRDLVTVKRRPPGGYTLTRSCHVAGISHEIGPKQWTTTFHLWSATPYTDYATSRWDQGLWDTSLWFA